MKQVGHYNFFFSLYIKMSERTYYQRNRDMILDRAKKYYEITKKHKKIKQQINIEIYQVKKKIYRENMKKTDIIRILKEYQKN